MIEADLRVYLAGKLSVDVFCEVPETCRPAASLSTESAEA